MVVIMGVVLFSVIFALLGWWDRILGAFALLDIRINVVVTDQRGRPVVDLQARDFQLDDNGVTQSLASVELRRAPAGPAAASVTPSI